MGDFETVNKIDDCRVWASCLTDIMEDEVLYVSNNINDTMMYLEDLLKFESVTLYYHNLSFDGRFILPWLFNNGFTYNDKLDSKKCFKTLITDNNVFYQFEIKWGKGKKAHKLTILDSLKLIPLKVEQIPKAFGLDVFKGEIDYNMERPIGHILTKEERSYLERDCLIVGKALKIMFGQGLTRMTIGGNALASYKELIGKDNFNYMFPRLSKEVDDFIRKSYKGGYVYCNPMYQGKLLKTMGCSYDVNSLYPSRMYYDMLPYGKPVHYNGMYPDNPNYPLYIQHITCKFEVKKNHIPTIQLKGNARFGANEYIKSSGLEPVDLYLTNIDLEIFLRHYDVRMLQYIDGYMFKGRVGMFNAYIDYWMGIKIQAENEGNDGMRQIAKLMLNNLYGKFGQNTNGTLKIPTLDHDGIVRDEIFEGDERKLVYTAMASFITAYARRVTQTAFQENYKRCCYCDTDSIHLIGEEAPKIDIDSTRLGAWKYEGSWDTAKFLRAKTYMEQLVKDGKGNEIEPKLNVKCAGMSDRIKKKVTFENFKPGFSSWGNLKQVTVKGGVILVDNEFTLK